MIELLTPKKLKAMATAGWSGCRERPMFPDHVGDGHWKWNRVIGPFYEREEIPARLAPGDEHIIASHSRDWHQRYARSHGYFWLPCPACNEWHGGHEWSARGAPGYGIEFRLMDDEAYPITSSGVCGKPDCVEWAKEETERRKVKWLETQRNDPNDT